MAGPTIHYPRDATHPRAIVMLAVPCLVEAIGKADAVLSAYKE